MELLASLNPEQVDVVLHDQGPLLVGAVAGSGKSTAMTRRIAYLVRERNVAPSRILAVTFSRRGAKVMQSKLADLGITSAKVSTWHSFCRTVLNTSWSGFDQLQLDKDGRRYKLALKIVTGYEDMRWENRDLAALERFIGLCKAEGLHGGVENDMPAILTIARDFHAERSGPERSPSLLATAFCKAEARRLAESYVTLDDWLVMARDLLRDDADARTLWQGKFEHLMVDEAQDNNLVQNEIGDLLAAKHHNYAKVGDPGQSLYAFRGSRPDLFLDFVGTYDAKVIRMHRNYRCGDAIGALGNTLLHRMEAGQKLEGLSLTTERKVPGETRLTEYGDRQEEGRAVAEQILAAHEDGIAWKEQCVLYRTNALSRAIEEALLKAKIPYRVLRGTPFYERAECKDLLSYLRVVSGRSELEDMLRIVNRPSRYLSKKFSQALERFHGEAQGTQRWTDLFNAAAESAEIKRASRANMDKFLALMKSIRAGLEDPDGEQSPATILGTILLTTKYKEWITKEEGEESADNDRVANLDELMGVAALFPTIDALLDHVEISVQATKDAAERSEDEDADLVTLQSVHSAKGDERGIVYFIGVNDRVVPHVCGNPHEELRIAYVAITRARDSLRISWVRRDSMGRPMEPSPFLPWTERPAPVRRKLDL